MYITYMSIAKPKPFVRKAAKAAPAADKPRIRLLSSKDAAGASRRGPTPLPERLMSALGSVVTVSIADARTQMPKMVRSSATGHTYLICNARTTDAPSAVLIGLDELNRVVAEPTNPRTLGEVLATLPFSGMALAPLTAGALPGSGLPTALLPE